MKMSRSLNVLLGLFISLSLGLGSPFSLPVTAQPATTQTTQFSDVPTNYWAYDSIQKLANSQVISGFPDGKFRPEEPVTRAQFAAVLSQAFLRAKARSSTPFADVRPNYWAADAINAARSSGFMAGYPDNRFRPDAPIRRVDAWVALAKGLKYADASENTLNRYSDAGKIPEYAAAAVRSLAQAEILVPDSKDTTKLSPLKSATRADLAAFVYQAMMTTSDWQNKPVSVIPAKTVAVSFSNTGERLATLTPERDKVQIWNAQTGKLSSEIGAVDENRFWAIALSGDGTKVGAIAVNKTTETPELGLWNVQTKERLWQQTLDKSSDYYHYYVAFQPGDQMLLAQVELVESSSKGEALPTPGNAIRFYDTTTGAVARSLTSASPYNTISFSQDGVLLAGTDGAKVDLWQPKDSQLVSSFEPGKILPSACDGQCPYYPVSTAFGSDSHTLSVLSQNLFEGRFNLWDAGREVLITPFYLDSVETDRDDSFEMISPDGKYILLGGRVSGLRLIDSQTGYSGWRPDLSAQADSAIANESTPADFDAIYSLRPAFSANGDYLAIPALDTTSNVYIFSKRKPQ